MLTSLTIIDFTLVKHLDIEFFGGMTAVTGETGAGKSLILDALGLALGDRGDTDRIRQNANKAEVAANFDLRSNNPAQQWLEDNGFEGSGFEGNGSEGDGFEDSNNGKDLAREILVRRSLTQDGRSRGFINGQAATMTQLRELGGFIIDIHNQHEHQSLLERNQQRALLDDFGGHRSLCESVNSSYQAWSSAKNNLDQYQLRSEDSAAQRELLTFQLEELNQLKLEEGEIEALEKEQSLLANAEAIIADTQQVLALCDDSEGDDQLSAQAALNKACVTLEAMPQRSDALEEALALLNSARIQVSEAVIDLQQHLASSELDPVRLEQVEERLSLGYQLARKHKIDANDLPALVLKLSQQLEKAGGAELDAEVLAAEVEALEADYLKAAGKLSKARSKAASQFCAAVNQQLASLAMAGASIEMSLLPNKDKQYSASGLESVEMLVSTNPGQAHRPLNKVASGGELSRISLAIQVVAAEHSSIPVLVFDEVDVGVGGATASVIGKLLRKLGDKGQVICISHQAQVASYAQWHLLASKAQIENATESQLIKLDSGARKKEIARMLGGEKITKTTLSHAEEMLAVSATS
ncbi:MAG: DNA repair protein RecN [Porticoccaceae bacterium]|nr:DNA repair protein RecN [Porticoccaceae bacterium]